MLIYIDGIRFSLQYMGMKYCHRCGMFTALEPSKLCKCCHKGMKRSSKNYYRKRTRYENEDDSRWEKVPITIQELRYYASMIGEGYPTWTKERKKEEGYNCLSPR